MRILVINSNTSEIVTEKVEAAATGTFGARVLGTRAENAIAEHSTIALAARHASGCDAVLIAVSYDTGLRGARELLDIPVVGMTEAGLLTACMLGGSIGVITFGRRVLPVYQELVAGYGLAARIAGWRVMESTAAYGRGAHPELDRELIAAANDLVRQDFADCILITGAVMAGVPARLRPDVPVPIVDCIVCGVQQAELLARQKHPKPRAGSYAAPAGRELIEVDPSIVAAFTRAGR